MAELGEVAGEGIGGERENQAVASLELLGCPLGDEQRQGAAVSGEIKGIIHNALGKMIKIVQKIAQN